MQKVANLVDMRENVSAHAITRDRNGEYRFDGQIQTTKNPNFGKIVAEIWVTEGGEKYSCYPWIGNAVLTLEKGVELFRPVEKGNFFAAFLEAHAHGYLALPIEVGGIIEDTITGYLRGKIKREAVEGNFFTNQPAFGYAKVTETYTREELEKLSVFETSQM